VPNAGRSIERVTVPSGATRTCVRYGRVVDKVTLTAEQRVELDQIMGIGQQWTFGNCPDRPREEAIAALHAVTRDGVVLGVALGVALAAFEIDGWPSYCELAELYRAAGADDHIAAVELAWQRDRHASRYPPNNYPS
jgi:hypothetical protein